MEPEGEYDTVLFDGRTFDAIDAGNALFIGCTFSAVTLNGGTYRRSRFNDVSLRGVRAVGADLAETDWLDAKVHTSAFSGVEAFSVRWRRVVLQGCKLDSVNFRAAKFTDVVFEDCVLRDVDWAGAALDTVRFPGSALHRVRFDKATMADVDFRRAAELDVADGYTSLRGAIVDSGQLMSMASALAAALGIMVEDD